MTQWSLELAEVGILIASAPIRVSKLLREPETRLCRRERDRLALLTWIDALLQELLPVEMTAAEWLRSSATMEAFEGSSPLDQLLHYDLKASTRLCSALCALSRAVENSTLRAKLAKDFDQIID
jgi:hypothetical protein